MTRGPMRAALCALLFALPLSAQQSFEPLNPLPLGDILLSLPTSHIPAEGLWEVKFTHRFNQSIDEGDGIDSLFGLDSNANVGIGFSYVALRDLQLSIYRSNVLDDIELAAKYVVLQQARALPLGLALRGGLDWRTAENLEDRVSFFGQAILSHQFAQRAEVFVVPTFATKAGQTVVGDRSAGLFDDAFNVPIGVAVMLTPAFSVVAELVPPNDDLPEELEADLGWAVGIKRAIGGHYFEILLSNSNGTHVDQYVTSTYQGAPLRTGDLQLGFNIERRFGKRRR